MPSTKDPTVVVNPGPGRLSAGVVPAGALLFPPGGGSNAALQAHITDPIDAHMASAIGINPFYPPTGEALLTSVGGVIDGESVLDFIDEFKDLIPVRPNSIGFNLPEGISSGIPSWGLLDAFGIGSGTSRTGGYPNGANVEFSHFLVPNGTANFAMSGLLFPADRGVVAFYKNTDGNFFNAGATTLVAALYLGSNPPPGGIPGANFVEANRKVQQANYVASGVGLDQFGLTFRLPYLSNYTAYPGTPYGPFSINFYRYQLAVFSLLTQALAAGDAQNYLVVHWKETYATTLASIQPANLTIGNLVASKCYSAVPAGGNFDDNTTPVYNVNRHHVFRDAGSGTSPAGTLFSSAQVAVPTTVFLSGVQFYDNGGTPLHWNVDIRASDLFSNSFDTGSVANPPLVPNQFQSANDPMVLNFNAFGGTTTLVPYSDLRKATIVGNYSNINSPQAADIAQYINAALAIPGAGPASPANGYGLLRADLKDPFNAAVQFLDTTRYLFNSYPQSGGGTASTTTLEPFVDEKYRYALSFDPTTSAAVPIVPGGGNIYASNAALLVTGPDLQEVGNVLAYPQVNYGAAAYRPVGQPDYSGFPAGDGANHLRRYQRAFDTGVPRNTGKLRIRGLAYAAIQTNAAYNGTETTGHLVGGAIIQLKVPGGGGTGWLDLGRAYGDPGIATTDFYGCATGITTVGPDVFVTFNTTAFTSNNGSGNFLLFVRVSLINGAGTALTIDELEWLPP
jgi:hypothetical protein